jgi:hypothetical protein
VRKHTENRSTGIEEEIEEEILDYGIVLCIEFNDAGM